MKSLNILLLCALVAVAKSQPVSVESYYTVFNSSVLHVDNYLTAHRLQFSKNIWFYDYQIENFKILYNGRIDTLDILQSSLVDAVIQTNEKLIPLQMLNDVNSECIEKYKKLIPPVSSVKYNMQLCISAAKNQLNSLILNPSNTNKTLQTYYLNTYEKSVQTCKKNFPNSEYNYTLCVQSAVSAANVYTISNQKTFDIQMDSAASSAQVYIKRANLCSFDVLNATLSSTAQANTLIELCIRGKDDCNRCKGYFCDNVYYVPSSAIDYHNQTMKNVFYGANPNVKCLMLDVY